VLASPLTGLQQQRLLPATLEMRIIGLMSRASGFILLALVAGLWLSLLTWSASDPSLTHATGGPARNAMGPVGAIVSDLMLQTLGLATALVLLAPMFWSLELILGERVLRFRNKAAFYPLAILVLAGALSSLPIPSSWPLHHGLGGALGDVGYNLVANAFSILNPDRASMAAGLLYFITGFPALLYSIGIELRELAVIATRSPSNAGGTWSENLWAEAQRLRQGLSALRTSHEEKESEPLRTLDLSLPMGRFRSIPEAPARPRTAPLRNAPSASILSEEHVDRGSGFDAHTDATSEAIAKRFAPETSTAATPDRRVTAALKLGKEGRRSNEQFKRPNLALLRRPAPGKTDYDVSAKMQRGIARLLEDVLADFGVKGEVKEIRPGPVVTLFELEPARGTKSSRIIGLADDISRSMSAQSVRVAVVPGRNAIGIELPNVKREPVLLREILESAVFQSSAASLPIALGKSIGGEPIVADLARMPHLLVAGTTGSGKSVGINSFVLSLLYRHSPADCRLLMIDPKMLELSVYNGIPHLLTPVVTDPHKAVAALNWVVGEMEERYKRMAKLSVRSIDAFNNRVREAQKRGEVLARTVQTGFDPQTGEAIYEREEMGLEPMPYIVVVVDEFADLMIVAGKEIESSVQRLAQMARAAGIHLIMATQRPSVDVVTGTIKANFPTRISFKVASKVDSRTILNEQGAEQLLGQGDMLYSGGSGQCVRIHGPFVSDEEVETIADFLRKQGEPVYVQGVTETPPGSETKSISDRADQAGDLYDRAVALVLRDRKASTSYIQRRLAIGYNRAADLIERMERDGLISAANAVGKREILSGPSAGEETD
jgi:S-DNA-T family DNA segregation ATPase FtsK/SpoIIIE